MSYAEQYDAARGVAIVGIAGRFPGAPDLESLERLVRAGADALAAAPSPPPVSPPAPAGPLPSSTPVPLRGVLEDADRFDEGFFGLEAAEAARIDPQHRLFLQAAWEALEHAGHDPASFGGLIGVYACSEPAPAWCVAPGGERGRSPARASLADPRHGLASRTALALDLRGPALDVAAGEAGGLAAVCQAVQALQSFQCDLALAGAVALASPAAAVPAADPASRERSEGCSAAFDAHAGGTVPADGLAVVALRRLADALDAGDTIHAVIRGAATNHEGRGRAGLAVPSVDSQATVVATAQALAGIDPQTIGYIEADASAEVLADAVELAALTQAFRAGGVSGTAACALASVKTQLGHLGAASGVAGLVRAVLAVRDGIVPAHLHFGSPHPALELAGTPFAVNRAVRPWPPGAQPRRAGVSAFSAGGTNVHVVLEQAPAPQAVAADGGAEPAPATQAPQLLVLSARDPRALDRATRRLQRRLEGLAAQEGPRPALADIARTLQSGRRAFVCRRAWACNDLDDAVAQLSAPVTPQAAGAGQAPALAWLFPGDGAPSCGTGRELHAGEPVFRDELDACARALLAPLGGDLRDWLFPAPGQEDEARQRLARTDTGQPVLLAVQLALARLWASWGVEPAALLGHGVGEFAAACLGGTFERDDALVLVAQRARLVQQLPAGAMLAVLAPAEELQAELVEGVDIAARQAPALTVLSGPEPAIGRVAARLERRGVGHRRLATGHALQSSMVDPVLPAFEALVRRTPRRAPSRPWISGLTGRPVTAEQAQSPTYWARQLRETAHFADGLSLCLSAGMALLEIGPGDALARLALRHAQRDRSPLITASLPHGEAAADRDERRQLRAAAGRLWCAGVPLDWPALNPGGRRCVPLPGYPFARNRHPLEPPAAAAAQSPPAAAGGAVPADWIALFARQLAIMGEQLEMIRRGAAPPPSDAGASPPEGPQQGPPEAPAAGQGPAAPG